ncbi:MAG TPA: hypothetical protein VK115_10475 [Staphylococcus sp.]|nr:hypothetical protein [Staphylococcus sp.]
MINEMEELQKVKVDLTSLRAESPSMYEKLEYIASLTRQLSIHYKYLGVLMFSKDSEELHNNRPIFIRESVLNLYEQEVEKVKNDKDFELFKNMVQASPDVAYSQIFLIILGAEPSFVFHNTIIK